MIILTFDTDWIKEDILLETIVNTLKKYQLKASFFVTGEYECLKHPLFEINPHINFNANDDYYCREFLKIKKWAPKNAFGIRNHSLYYRETLRKKWEELGVRYSSNSLMPLVQNIEPYRISKKIIELPIYFLDYWFMETFNKPNFNIKALKLSKPGLKILDFHAIHIGLNTPNLDYYFAHRKDYHNLKKIQEHKFKGKGVETIYNQLIDYLITNKITTYKLKEIYQKFKDKTI